MVSSAHPISTLVGLRVLMDGGNAFDAVVATAATLNVVEPYMSGIGGIGMALAYVENERRVRSLNFSGMAPNSAMPDIFTQATKNDGILASLVPGNLAGWLTLHNTYGSMDIERLFLPAIDYAENGFPLTFHAVENIKRTQHLLHPFPASSSIILGSDRRVPVPGTLLKQPGLAESLRLISKDGMETFYKGELASKIVKANRSLGGIFTEEDMAEYEPEWQEPINIRYRGYEVFTTPPNCSSFQVLQTLKLMEQFESDELSHQHPDTVHSLIEGIKLAVADRIKYAGDPAYIYAPINGLLSNSYAHEQAKRMKFDVASVVEGERHMLGQPSDSLLPGNPESFDGGMTTHFAVADRDGNVVTVTQTLGGGFGSGAVMGDTGIFLNNMANYFDLEENSLNVIGPHKKVDFVVAPTQTFRKGKFFLSLGTPGSFGILQTTPQMLMNVLDFGMNVQQAIETPRFRIFSGKNVSMEERFPIKLRRELKRRGHDIEVIDAWSRTVGGAQAIEVDCEKGVFHGGADPRRDGYALGW